MSAPEVQNLEVGVAVLATQMTQVIKDVEGLRGELRDHRDEHASDERARVSGRRWVAGFAVSGLVAVGGLYGWVALLLHR